MRKCFFILNGAFPRGGANSNYMQYLALCMKEIGYKPVVIAPINKEYFNEEITSFVQYKGITIYPLLESKKKLVHAVEYRIEYANKRDKILRDEKISGDDIVIPTFAYDVTCFWIRHLFHLRDKIGFKIISAPLELYARENFDGDDADARYARYLKMVDYYTPMSDMVLPISTYIDDYYRKKGCRTFCIPIMADCSEVSVREKEYTRHGQKKFVIPANGKMKDSLEVMLTCFSLLSDHELENCEIHICGVKEETIKNTVNQSIFDKIKKNLIIHKWMKYEELMDLYYQIHYLLLSRETAQMTLANFPSKVPETMAYGIVPVVSEVGDYTKFYLEDGVNSIFIKENTAENCAVSVRKALYLDEDEFRVLSSNARRCAEEKFDYRVWQDKLKKSLEQIY